MAAPVSGLRAVVGGSLRLVEVRRAPELDAAAALMRLAHVESRYGGSPFNAARFRRYHASTTLSDPDRHVLVLAYMGERAVGQLSVTCSYLYWTDVRVAVAGLVYVVAEHRRTLAGGRTFRRLLGFAADWAKARRVDEIQLQVNAGVRVHAIDAALRRTGFIAVGGNYVLPLGGG